MSSSNLNTLLLSNFSGQENVITIPKLYISLLKCHKQALLLNQIIFWSNKSTKATDGWFFKSYKDWSDETLIPESTVIKLIKKMVACGVCETKTKKVYNVNTLFIRPMMDSIIIMLESMINNESKNPPRKPKWSFKENQNGLLEKTKMDDSYKEQINTTDNYLHKDKESTKEKIKNDYEKDNLSVYDATPEPSKQLATPSPKKKKPIDLIVEDNRFNLPEQSILDYIATRKEKKAVVNKTVIKGLYRELDKCVAAGHNPVECFDTMVECGWKYLKIEWIENYKQGNSHNNKATVIDTKNTDWIEGAFK